MAKIISIHLPNVYNMIIYFMIILLTFKSIWQKLSASTIPNVYNMKIYFMIILLTLVLYCRSWYNFQHNLEKGSMYLMSQLSLKTSTNEWSCICRCYLIFSGLLCPMFMCFYWCFLCHVVINVSRVCGCIFLRELVRLSRRSENCMFWEWSACGWCNGFCPVFHQLTGHSLLLN
jgi:hypothetical protein